MRLLIAAVGRLKQGPERDLFRHYLGRTEMAGSKLGIAPVTVIEVPESRGPTPAARTAAEAMVMLGKVPPSHKLVCLDREGDQLGQAMIEVHRLPGVERDRSGACGVLRPCAPFLVEARGELVEPVTPRAEQLGGRDLFSRGQTDLARQVQLARTEERLAGGDALREDTGIAAPPEMHGVDETVLEAEPGCPRGEKQGRIRTRAAAT